jgi:GNAT superfamily N-acetyltransferase
MEREVTVRIGTLDDLDEMMKIAMAASYENGFVEPDPGKLLDAIYPSLMLHAGVVGIIGEPGGRIEGAILLRMGTLWYSDAPTLEEKAIYVDPEFRGAKVGRARLLAEFAKKYAEGLDIPLTIGVLSNTRTAGKIKLYERIFGQPAGVYFLYNAHTGQLGT